MIESVFASHVAAATSGTLGLVELMGAADTLSANGRVDLEVSLYRLWLQSNSDHPHMFVAYFNLGSILLRTNDSIGAKDAFEGAITQNPEFLPPYINLGLVYERLGLHEHAIAQWNNVVNKLATVNADNVGYKASALQQIGRLRESRSEIQDAEDALRQATELRWSQRDVLQHLIVLRQRTCMWPISAPLKTMDSTALFDIIAPLSYAAFADDPLFQLVNAYDYNRKDVGWPTGMFTAGPWATPETREDRPLRIGYLSSDLREHSIGFLMADMFKHHDRSKVHITSYYCGPNLSDSLMARFKADSDKWVDLLDMTDEAAACQILDDKIDILIDINGYTRFARTKMLGMRPAPIIVNWLGYPGTMGSPYHDYILADDHIIPQELEIYYSERVARLPCYQPNDGGREANLVMPSRAEVGLPEDAVVYCCFNGMHKITRNVFKRWMTILHEVPGSVLWLLSDLPAAEERLRQAAISHGVAPERLIFAGRRNNADHMGRYGLADLMLDTAPYGAHTTASDALWVGVPVITYSGRSFASRVCGSLAKAAGIPELVCHTPDEYVALAIRLGRDRAELQRYRAQLLRDRTSSQLFDAAFLVRHMEQVFAQMWDEYSSGTLKRPELANLDTYRDLFVGMDHEAVDRMSNQEYDDFYRRRIAYRNAFSPYSYDDPVGRKFKAL